MAPPRTHAKPSGLCVRAVKRLEGRASAWRCCRAVPRSHAWRGEGCHRSLLVGKGVGVDVGLAVACALDRVVKSAPCAFPQRCGSSPGPEGRNHSISSSFPPTHPDDRCRRVGMRTPRHTLARQGYETKEANGARPENTRPGRWVEAIRLVASVAPSEASETTFAATKTVFVLAEPPCPVRQVGRAGTLP